MIVIPYVPGSAAPNQIAQACQERGHTATFLVDPTDPEAAANIRVLEAFGVVIKAENPADGIAALAGRAPDAVVTFAEATLPVTATLAIHYGLPGHSPQILERLTDKAVQRRRLNECGVGKVATVEVHGGQSAQQLAGVPLPGVLKPCAGAGSRDTLFVESVAEISDELARHPAADRFVVEQRVVGSAAAIRSDLADYVSVETAVVGHDVLHLGCTGRLPLAKPARERGLVFPISPPPDLLDRLYAIASAAIEALEIRHGLVHSEIKIGPDGLQIIEVNARLGGGLATIAPAAGGHDLVGLAIDLALGRPCPPIRPATGVALHLYVQPPYEATQLVVAPDVKKLRAQPGVYAVSRRAQAGDPVDWRVGSAGRILDVFIEADNLDDLMSRADAVDSAVATMTTWRSLSTLRSVSPGHPKWESETFRGSYAATS